MRSHGEGTITQRKDGRWQAQISLGDGKRKTFYGKTKKEVREKLRVAINEQKQGKLALGSSQTVKQFLDDWLENFHKSGIRYHSYVTYRNFIKNHILPSFGHVKLEKLTSRQIDTFYSERLKSGFAAETVRGIHRMLHKAFADAVRWKLVSYNVCDEVKQPRADEYEKQILTEQQAKKLLEAAKSHTLEAMLTMAVATGMRQGELLGLKWDDIDFEKRIISIRRTAYAVTGKGIVVDDPKTAVSKAKIMIPQFVVDALVLHKARQEEIKVKSGEKWRENGIVFCNHFGGFMHAHYVRDLFKRLLRDANLPGMRFHDLRHSAATLLLGMGIHPKLVQSLLRHSDIAQTMKYSHIQPSMQQNMMDDLDKHFKE